MLGFISKKQKKLNEQLTEAAGKGNLGDVQRLLKEGAQANGHKDQKKPPLVEAAAGGHLECVRFLLVEKGADINIKNHLGNTPLMTATEAGHFECVQFLLSAHADTEVIGKGTDGKERTALDWAEYRSRWKIMKLLGMSEKDVQEKMNQRLVEAAGKGNFDDLRRLIEAGAEVNCYKDSDQPTPPLFGAAWRGHAECVKFLLEKGAEVNIKTGLGNTPLITATAHGHLECVKVLLATNADITVISDKKSTALEIARRYDYKEIEKLLSPPEKPKPDEIILQRPLADRTLQEIFNFKTRERISLVRKEADGPVEAITRERFELIETDPSLREAFEEHLRCGGTVEESEIFPHTLFKRPARRTQP